ncbi:Glutathione transport system permease protein GsiC [Geodia barretti]|uniref:Glutathione transport system permease protein GsiC n=1 Tax=Geodia barretti TaxID=519541 RepID=A0AA35SJJ6_GEOBA|nr:Glutathione transport system permease protein GsiC [Geodia barretti]
MTNYLAKRAGQMVLTLFLIVTLTFFLVQAQPGDYATFYALNPDLPAEVRAQIKESFGLDKPLWEQYLIHMKNTFTGNFGVSFGHFPRPVIEVLAERLPRTAVLFLTATAASFYIGFFLGKAIAWRRGGVLEYAATISGATLFTAFTPAFGLMMIWIFAFKLGWLPVGKFLDPLHMILPIVTLTLISFAGTMLLTRNSMLETMREDYVMAARAKGLPEKVVRDRHAARNALLPVVTSLVYSLIFAIDGSVIIEAVFSWPGTGMTLLDAVRSEDLPLVMGAMMFIGLFSLLAHVIVDVLYVYLDPRIRYQ